MVAVIMSKRSWLQDCKDYKRCQNISENKRDFLSLQEMTKDFEKFCQEIQKISKLKECRKLKDI